MSHLSLYLGALPKMSRWFSWNQIADAMLYEWRAFKMIMEDSLQVEAQQQGVAPMEVQQGVAPNHEMNASGADRATLEQAAKQKVLDPRAELGLMKKTLGGFKLAYHLMTDSLYVQTHVLAIATRPLYTWYVDELASVKSPEDSVQASIALSLDRWQQAAHVQQTVAALLEESALQWICQSGVIEPGVILS